MCVCVTHRERDGSLMWFGGLLPEYTSVVGVSSCDLNGQQLNLELIYLYTHGVIV